MHVLDFIKLGRSDNPTSCIHPYLLSCLLWASGTTDSRALNVFLKIILLNFFPSKHIFTSLRCNSNSAVLLYRFDVILTCKVPGVWQCFLCILPKDLKQVGREMQRAQKEKRLKPCCCIVLYSWKSRLV